MKVSLTETSKQHALKRCLSSPPKDAEVVGTVTTNAGKGALVKRLGTGIYAQYIGGVIKSLDQHDIMRRLVLSEIGAVKSKRKSLSSAKNALLGGRPKKE